MQFNKYKKAFVVYLIYLIFFCIISFIAMLLPEAPPLSPFIPGENEGLEIFLVTIIIWPIISIISAIIGGYVIAPLFLVLYKKVIGRKMVYGIQDKPKSEVFTKIFAGFFPSLMSLTLVVSYLLSPDILEIFVPIPDLDQNPGVSDAEAAIQIIFGVFVLSIFTIPISMAAFSSAWFLLDAGFISLQDTTSLTEAKSVGNWYINVLKGYAGLSTIYAYYLILTEYFSSLYGNNESNVFLAILDLSVLLPIPIFMSMATIPALIILDIFQEHRALYIRKWAKKLGIVNKVKVSFETIN